MGRAPGTTNANAPVLTQNGGAKARKRRGRVRLTLNPLVAF
jgi:hypothetical protein